MAQTNQNLLEKKKRLLELKQELMRRESVVYEAQKDGSFFEMAHTFGRQGLTFGFGDEIAAAKRGGLDFLNTRGGLSERTEAAKLGYQTSHLQQKLRREALADQYPVLSFLSEAGGGGFTGGVGFSLARNQLRNLPKIARLPGAGAVEGSIYGIGASDPGDRIYGGIGGAGVGAVATPFAVAAGVTAMRLLRPTAIRLGEALFGTPKDKAIKQIQAALAADNITPQEADVLMRVMGQDAVMADLGDTLARQGRVVTSEMGPAASEARRFLDSRQSRAHEQLRQSARRATGSNNFDRGIIEIVNGAESKAGPIYDEVFSAVLDVAPLTNILNRPAMLRAQNKAKTILKNEGYNPQIADDLTDVRYMDAVKRALDDQIGVARRTGRGNEVRVLNELKNEFLEVIDNQVPRYADARSVFAGEQAMREAAEFGRTVFSNNRARIPDLSEQIGNMTDSELEAARMGFLDWLAEELGKQSTSSNRLVNKFSEVPRFSQLTKMLFPDQAAVEDFLSSASSLSTFGRTRNLVTGGSPTARIVSDRGAMADGLVNTVIDSAVSPSSALANAVRLIRSNTELTPEVLEEMGNILFNPNIIPSRLRVNPAMRAFQIPRLDPITASGVAGGMVGSQQDSLTGLIPMNELLSLLGNPSGQ